MVISNLDFLPGLVLWLIHGEVCFWFRVTFVLLSGIDWPRHTLEQATDCFDSINTRSGKLLSHWLWSFDVLELRFLYSKSWIS